MKTAAQAAAAWSGSSTKAIQNYSDGVAGYQGDWATATVNQESALLSGVTNAITSGRWAGGVRRAGTQGWKTATENKKGNYGTGFTAGASNQAKAIAKIMQALSSAVPNLPARGTFEQNKLRATTLMDTMHALKGTLGAAS